MEQARYWMWAKTKPDLLNPRILSPAAMGDSWEEQAFAEDAAGTLGGCVWPPRSYSCSFCRREFRSAQALGGHMNVHRRDRARMKQSQNQEIPTAPQVHALNTCTSLDPSSAPYAPPMRTILCNNSNPDRFPDPFVSTRSSLIRVSEKVVNKEEIKTSTFSFFTPQQNYSKNTVVSLSPPRSWSGFVMDRGPMDSTQNEEKETKVVEAEKDDGVTTEDRLSVKLDLFVCRGQTNEEEVASFKRRRIEAKPLSFFPRLSPSDRCLPHSDVVKPCSGSDGELDLELRLGDAPK